MVGVTRDAVAAIEAIAALDPSSELVELLAVRELNRLEHRAGDLKALEKVTARLAGAKRTRNPRLFELVAGHAAALRGDLPAARQRLGGTAKGAKGVPRFAVNQAQVSLALALAMAKAWRPGNTALGEELASLLATWIDTSPGQPDVALWRIRAALSDSCKGAGRLADAELFLATATASPSYPPPETTAPWNDRAFIRAMIARVASPKSALDRFMIDVSGQTSASLTGELVKLHLVKGDFTGAQRVLSGVPEGEALGTDPFVMHVIDCHECDHGFDGDPPWTLKSFVSRLVALERAAGGKGEAAAKAAYELGSGTYNVTFNGNARVVAGVGHNGTADTKPAERWFKRAHDLTADRELKARAATMAAKCELARDGGRVSKSWYPALRALAGTNYEREVLKECGWYRRWTKNP